MESRYSLSVLTVRRQRRAATSSDELQPPHGMAANCATRWVARTPPPAPPKSAKFGLSPIPPRRSAPGRQGRRFLAESRYSLSSESKALSPGTNLAPIPSGSGRAALRVAGARPTVKPNPPPKARPHARPGAARKPIAVFEPKELSQPKAQPSSPPRVRLTAAPLSLRRVFRAPCAIHSISAHCRNS